MYPKYELIASHAMKRSFATNYFGKIETPILMEITGHSRESTFLSYIGRTPIKTELQMCLWNDCGHWKIRVDRCSKPMKKPVIFKISWPFHGNLRISKK